MIYLKNFKILIYFLFKIREKNFSSNFYIKNSNLNIFFKLNCHAGLEKYRTHKFFLAPSML